MKKLNENVLRKLILETIDEQVLTEGKKKKKLKEAEPVPEVHPEDESNWKKDGTPVNLPPEEQGLNGSQIAQLNNPKEISSMKDVEDSLNFFKQASTNKVVGDTLEPSFKAFVEKLKTYVFGKKQEEE